MKLLNPQTWGKLSGSPLFGPIARHLKIPILLIFTLNVLYAQDMALANGPVLDEIHAVRLTVSGTVTDTDGQPLLGATVRVKKSTVGTLTQDKGAYRISAPEDASLIFSFIGYEKQEVAVIGRSVIDIVL